MCRTFNVLSGFQPTWENTKLNQFSHTFSNSVFVCTLAIAFMALLPTNGIAEDDAVVFSGNDMAAWGKNVAAWKVVENAKLNSSNPKLLTSQAGKGILINGDKGRTRNLLSTHQHGDVQAHIEFMVPKGSNSGVYFQGRYEVQILDSFGKKTKLRGGDCGGIYQRWGKNGGYEGHPPKVNASKAPGEWQTFDVTFRAARFDKQGKKIANAVFVKVVHNGKIVHENVQVTGPTRSATFNDEKPLGPLMLQGDHGPVAFRNIQLKPLSDK